MLKNTILETERTYLRKLSGEDAENFFNLNFDPEVLKFTGDNAFETIEEARKFLEQYDQYEKYGVGRLAVIDKKTNKFMGWCGLKFSPDYNEYDIGFRFFKAFWNQGYATETAGKYLEFGFNNLKISEIVGRSRIENRASIKVFEKIGMAFKNNFDFDGYKGVVYQIAKDDFRKIE
ncbi:MAG: GNAT family N-acetyltransferase [Bacteroidia bacterium]